MKGRKKGGRLPLKAAGNPNVFAEAEKKKGGRVAARKKGGAVKAKPELGFMTGGAVRPRLDRPGRKTGGGVGANKSPLSTAHNTASTGESSKPTDTYGGAP